MKIAFKERIRKIILDHCGGSNKEFADRINIVPSTILAWDDEHFPKGDILKRIHSVFNVDINWLLTGKETPYLPEKTLLAGQEASEHGRLQNELLDVDAEMSFQRLAVLAGIKMDHNTRSPSAGERVPRDEKETALNGRPFALQTDNENTDYVIDINTSESFQKLAGLAGITGDDWLPGLADIFQTDIMVFKVCMDFDRIPRVLASKIEQKGYPQKKWVLRNLNKTDLSFRRLKDLAAVKGRHRWVGNLADALGLASEEILKAIGDDHIPRSLIADIEAKGFPENLWKIEGPLLRDGNQRDFSKKQLMTMAEVIIISDTLYSKVLERHILFFYDSIQLANRINELETRMDDFENHIKKS